MFPVFKLSPCYMTYKSFILRGYIISEIISENLQVTMFTYLLSLMFFFFYNWAFTVSCKKVTQYVNVLATDWADV